MDEWIGLDWLERTRAESKILVRNSNLVEKKKEEKRESNNLIASSHFLDPLTNKPLSNESNCAEGSKSTTTMRRRRRRPMFWALEI